MFENVISNTNTCTCFRYTKNSSSSGVRLLCHFSHTDCNWEALRFPNQLVSFPPPVRNKSEKFSKVWCCEITFDWSGYNCKTFFRNHPDAYSHCEPQPITKTFPHGCTHLVSVNIGICCGSWSSCAFHQLLSLRSASFEWNNTKDLKIWRSTSRRIRINNSHITDDRQRDLQVTYDINNIPDTIPCL